MGYDELFNGDYDVFYKDELIDNIIEFDIAKTHYIYETEIQITITRLNDDGKLMESQFTNGDLTFKRKSLGSGRLEWVGTNHD